MTQSYWNQDSDPYQYPDSPVLRNIPDIPDQKALELFEHRATALRLDEVIQAISKSSINLTAWQTIHRTLFQDVYAWAGEIRSVQLAKGSTVFAMPEHIEAEAKRIFNQMAADDLTDPNRMAYYFGELNVLHPFREGNGRTQKLLFDEIARRVEKQIIWSEMGVDELLKAVIAAFHHQDYQTLEKLFSLAIKPL
ncbi:MAG: Fic family protein [Rickettsiales bacterium]